MDDSLYQKLKQAINKPLETLVGRENERSLINDFFTKNFENFENTSTLYISGNPGTGKTALIQEFINKYNNNEDEGESLKLTKKRKLKTNKLGESIYYLNCTSLSSSKQIYSKLYKLIVGEGGEDGNNKILDDKLKLENSILNGNTNGKKKDHKTINLIILDEIDQLLGSRGNDNNEELHQLIEWTFLPNSTLSLIGISNTLNLIEKFLPKLKIKGYTPLCINFLPYNVNELIDILKFKVKDIAYKDGEGNDQPLINPKAIEFCSRKVASDTGDLRRALDLILQVIDLTIEEFERSDKTEYIQININQALLVTKQLNQNLINNSLLGVNISQKLILLAILHIIKDNKVLKFDEVYDKYCDLCLQSELFQPITQTEFQDCLTNLESLGSISITKKKVKKQNQIIINLISRESDILGCTKGNLELEDLLPKNSN